MTVKTILLSREQAAFVEQNAANYGCELIEISMVGSSDAKVTVNGEDENVKNLFYQIGER